MTLVEAAVAAGLFSMLAVVLFMVMGSGVSTYYGVSGSRDVGTSLRKAEVSLLTDLENAPRGGLERKWIGSGNGDALWFRSATDPLTGEFRREPTGVPDWQTNIVYYLIRPNNHAGVAGGYNCSADPTPNGDGFCPHKMLIRKVVNQSTLLTSGQVDTFLTPPSGYDVSAMTDAGNPLLLETRIVAANLLWFRVFDNLPEVEIELAGARIRDAERRMGVGSTTLLGDGVTTFHSFGTILRNF